MSKSHRFTAKRQRWMLIAVGCVAAILLGVGGSLEAISAGSSTSGNLKPQAARLQATWVAQQSGQQAPKTGNQSAKPSCPINLNVPPEIVNMSANPPLPGQDYDSYIIVISVERVPYTIFGQVNQIGVSQSPLDPCAPNTTPIPTRHYADPHQPGQITLTGVTGDVVTFTTAAHTSGTFNYVTGQYQGA